MLATTKGHTGIIKKLIAYGADVNMANLVCDVSLVISIFIYITFLTSVMYRMDGHLLTVLLRLVIPRL